MYQKEIGLKLVTKPGAAPLLQTTGIPTMTENPNPRPPFHKRNARITAAALAVAALSFGAGGIVFIAGNRIALGLARADPRQE